MLWLLPLVCQLPPLVCQLLSLVLGLPLPVVRLSPVVVVVIIIAPVSTVDVPVVASTASVAPLVPHFITRASALTVTTPDVSPVLERLATLHVLRMMTPPT